MKAILHATDSPAESVAEQLERLQAYARVMGWTPIRETDLHEAVSACCRHNNAALLVTRLERLGPPETSIPILKRLQNLGRDFVSLAERIDTTTTTGKAFWDAIPLAEKLADLRIERRKRRPKPKKRGKRPAYGYRTGPDGQPIEDEKEQEVLRQIREMVDSGMSFRTVCRRLDAAGIKRRGKKWENYHGWLAKLLERGQPAA